MNKFPLTAALAAALCFASCGEGTKTGDPQPNTAKKATSDAMKMASFELERSP